VVARNPVNRARAGWWDRPALAYAGDPPTGGAEGKAVALYDCIGSNYAGLRRPDPRIASALHAALGDAVSVVNVGAGTGSYEPTDRAVVAVEPSALMIRQRPAGAAPCLQGCAEALPLATGSVDAAMGLLTLHHWTDVERGLAEMARVARKRVVLLTWVPDSAPFWLTADYFPEITAIDERIFAATPVLTGLLRRIIGPVVVSPVPIPDDCSDGFLGAYWRRPDSYLSAEVRGAISSFSMIDAEPGLARLRDDLASGRWAERNRPVLDRTTLDLGYRIVRCEIGSPQEP
jgi:SAM-dependent methyltransferase